MTPTAPYRVIFTDNLPKLCAQIERILGTAGIQVESFLSPRRAIEELKRHSCHLLITTLCIPEMGGFDVIRNVRSAGLTVPIMMITAKGSDQAAIEAIRLGASDYMNMPVAPELLLARVRRLLENAEAGSAPPIHQLITADPATRAVLETVAAIAETDSRVLITGETGTGKQLIAQTIHHASRRRLQPFVDVNCAAIPESLLESELFGHEKGAFTGAESQRIGRFEEAGKGTIFLDEVGEMSYQVQAKLLKVLQDGRFSRVGGARQLKSEARVIAATNRDLEKEVAQGRFRSDLYYRLQVISIPLPALRDRPADIPLMAEYFLKRYTKPGHTRSFSPEAMRAMLAYSWPGNIRELENLVERVAVLSRSAVIPLDMLPKRMVESAAGAMGGGTTGAAAAMTGSYRQARKEWERGYVTALLRRSHGNMAAAAREAKIDRSQFFRLVRRLGVDPETAAS